jgi:hypothetical protein
MSFLISLNPTPYTIHYPFLSLVAMVINTSSLEPFDFNQLWAAWEEPKVGTIQALNEGSAIDGEVDGA